MIFRLKDASLGEYWIHFMALFSGVQAFGYNSAKSEPTWIKSGALRVRVQCRGHRGGQNSWHR